MALFNKLFSSNKNNSCRNIENLSEKIVLSSKDQVRVILFRECDFRGRKLLFDSRLVQRITIDVTSDKQSDSRTNLRCPDKYAEVSNGFGYWYTKPSSDVNRFGEMVFGSVAMSYRGTSFKIHSLKSPRRLMFSQIFPSPRHRRGPSSSAPSQSFVCNSLISSHSLERSILLDDSIASSGNSINDRSSICSSCTWDNRLTNSRRYSSIPLDVLPIGSTHLLSGNSSSPNTNVDSGFGGERSTNSISSGPRSASLSTSFFEGEEGFSSGSLYKRWLRSSSTSLEPSNNYLHVNSLSDDCLVKPNVRSSKLGLAIVIELPFENESFLEQFLMEHSTLIESMIWRTRAGIEIAYLRHCNFVSLIYEVVSKSVQWLIDLLSGPRLSVNLWDSLAPFCDNSNSIINNNDNIICGTEVTACSNTCESTDGSIEGRIHDFTFFNLTKYFRSNQFSGIFKNSYSCSDKNLIAEKCVGELCELLDCVDIKHTNFFISTLVTAVLTHHLGWVSTVLPSSSSDKQKISSLDHACNPLWGQLADLYGCTGHPTKIAHTIITGTDKVELISKILNSLTYFIRCTDVHRKCVIRVDTQIENKAVDRVCRQQACIPMENYKIYADHLKDLKIIPRDEPTEANKKQLFCENLEGISHKSLENIEMKNFNVTRKLRGEGLRSFKSCTGSLNKISSSVNRLYPDLEQLSLNECDFKKNEIKLEEPGVGYKKVRASLTRSNEKFDLTNSLINEKVKKLCRVPASAISYHATTMSETNKLLDIHEINEETTKIYEPKKLSAELLTKSAEETEDVQPKNVLFVLGDDEELVCLKRSKLGSPKLSLDLEDCSLHRSNLGNEDTKPSTSWTSLDRDDEADSKLTVHQKFDRSQSVPPEDKKKTAAERCTKYRYSGVKFNIYRYPQIVTNYMKSKDLELSHLPFKEKNMKFNEEYMSFECTSSDYQFEETEALQTPSNASELEFTSDLVNDVGCSKNIEQNRLHALVEKTVVTEHPLQIVNLKDELEQIETWNTEKKMKIINLPLPKFKETLVEIPNVNYTHSLMRGIGERYISDMVLQGTSAPKSEWESALRKDLAMAARRSLLDRPIEEAVAIVANTDTWEVQLLSSHMYVVDRGLSGIRLGMSQLVSNMLESLLQMWKLHTPPEYCVIHIEQRLQEFCSLSKALAELLLATEFCSIDLLTSVLQLEVNDIPLLMAVASTHSPQVTRKYGISFQ